MRVFRGLAVVVTAGFGAAGLSQAQGIPAEIPPASYSATQYIDSAGCAFIRVGMAGATEWVPRVGRDRRQICGQTPSLGASAGASVAAPGATPVLSPAPPPVRPPRTEPQVVRNVATTPRPMVTQPRPLATAPRPAQPAAPGACAALPADIQQYFTGSNPRCGPQAVHPGDAARGLGGQQSRVAEPAAATPRQVVRYEVNPPPGYVAAWDDGRLNPYRGLGFAGGQPQMEQVWTNTVPRRLLTDPAPRGLRGLFARGSRPAVTETAQLIVVRP